MRTKFGTNWPAVAGLMLLLWAGVAPVQAEITAEHRKELEEIRKELPKVQTLIAKKNPEDAARLLDSLHARLHTVVLEAEIEETDRAVAGLLSQIDAKKKLVSKLVGGNNFPTKGVPLKGNAAAKNGAQIDFAKEVAPILVANCVRCHNADEAKGGLRLDTYAGLLSGGKTGKILTPGRSNGNDIIERLTADGPAMMPKGGRPLPVGDVLIITRWIDQGAKFTGDKKQLLSDLAGAYRAGTNSLPNETPDPESPRNKNTAKGRKPAKSGPVEIPKATGSEVVSFSRDIAPFMVNLCVGCHSGGGRGVQQTGFSLESIESLMRGGKSGPVVVPGNLEESRLWQLVGEQQPIKMPPGDAVLITRRNHRNLKTWILEGARFDTNNPKATLRSLVPTEEEIEAKKFSGLSAADFEKIRREQIDELWKKAFPELSPVQTEAGKDFLLCGSVPESRLKQVAQWAEEDSTKLRRFFHEKADGTLWRGKLAVFILKDRSEYEEFARTHDNADVIPRDVHGHAKCKPSFATAYVVLHDTGDDPSPATPSLRVSLTEQLTQALLLRSKNRLPDWVGRGTGLVIASRANLRSEYFRHLSSQAPKLLAALNSPGEVFGASTFSSDDIGPIGFTLVYYMIKNGAGGEGAFVRFVKDLQEGMSLENALQKVYNVTKDGLGTSYAASLASQRGTRKRGK